MSVPTNTKQSITLAQFEDNYIEGLYDEDHIVYLGQNASGTTVLVKRRLDLNGRRLARGRFLKQTLLITDLLASPTLRTRRGTALVSFSGGGNVASNAAVPISPALDDSTLANWLAFATVSNDTINFGGAGGSSFSTGVYAFIASTSVLHVRATRMWWSVVTVNPGLVDFSTFSTDLAGVADALEPHQHTLTTLSTGPSGVTATNVGPPAALNNVTINWMIVHV